MQIRFKKFLMLGYKFKEVCVFIYIPLMDYKDLINARKIFIKFKKFPIISVSRYKTKIERAMKIKNKN